MFRSLIRYPKRKNFNYYSHSLISITHRSYQRRMLSAINYQFSRVAVSTRISPTTKTLNWQELSKTNTRFSHASTLTLKKSMCSTRSSRNSFRTLKSYPQCPSHTSACSRVCGMEAPLQVNTASCSTLNKPITETREPINSNRGLNRITNSTLNSSSRRSAPRTNHFLLCIACQRMASLK